MRLSKEKRKIEGGLDVTNYNTSTLLCVPFLKRTSNNFKKYHFMSSFHCDRSNLTLSEWITVIATSSHEKNKTRSKVGGGTTCLSCDLCIKSASFVCKWRRFEVPLMRRKEGKYSKIFASQEDDVKTDKWIF